MFAITSVGHHFHEEYLLSSHVLAWMASFGGEPGLGMTGAFSVSVLKVLSECSPDLGFSCCLITSCCLPSEVSGWG